jgi:hypothetical protein
MPDRLIRELSQTPDLWPTQVLETVTDRRPIQELNRTPDLRLIRAMETATDRRPTPGPVTGMVSVHPTVYRPPILARPAAAIRAAVTMAMMATRGMRVA